eukprot:4235609-Alexandrium_andersonii.AAC.1
MARSSSDDGDGIQGTTLYSDFLQLLFQVGSRRGRPADFSAPAHVPERWPDFRSTKYPPDAH